MNRDLEMKTCSQLSCRGDITFSNIPLGRTISLEVAFGCFVKVFEMLFLVIAPSTKH